ncbi:hypothetical protein B0T22DRAFT_12002 [Podospora appendiculata]|uniref:Uncharacterized protein n=1 Tax=Podospora appendiculata TaxID=314037 RepID=A0AAE1CFH2_9PEZI|nr:hypothetical protein B0T22DRAFT_12002 [Podospora appendiculata]
MHPTPMPDVGRSLRLRRLACLSQTSLIYTILCRRRRHVTGGRKGWKAKSGDGLIWVFSTCTLLSVDKRQDVSLSPGSTLVSEHPSGAHDEPRGTEYVGHGLSARLRRSPSTTHFHALPGAAQQKFQYSASVVLPSGTCNIDTCRHPGSSLPSVFNLHEAPLLYEALSAGSSQLHLVSHPIPIRYLNSLPNDTPLLLLLLLQRPKGGAIKANPLSRSPRPYLDPGRAI